MTSVACVTHRQPAADVSDEEERVMFEVAHHGVAAAQLGGPAVPLVVVADGAVADHGQDEGEDPLVATGVGGKQTIWIYAHMPSYSTNTLSCLCRTHAAAKSGLMHTTFNETPVFTLRFSS